MATFTTTTLDGDTLDALCWRELGTTEGGVVEQAYTRVADLYSAPYNQVAEQPAFFPRPFPRDCRLWA